MRPVLLDRLPRSVQIEQLLRQRIGLQFRPGDRFASETQLASEFGTSRTLIRGVLARLTADGMVRREPKRGTFVSSRPSAIRAPKLSDLIERLFRYDRGTSVKALEIGTTLGEASVKSRLGLGGHEPLVFIRRLVFLEGVPLTYILSFVPYTLGARLTVPELERRPLSALLARRYRVPIRRAVQTIQPAIADVDVARHLEVPVGSPLLLVEREFFRGGRRPVLYSRAYYRGDRYKYTVRLRLDRS